MPRAVKSNQWMMEIMKSHLLATGSMMYLLDASPLAIWASAL
jgi:hypothetical protein